MNRRHAQNFLDAVRSRDTESPNAEIEIGRHSTGRGNLASVGVRAGGQIDAPPAASLDVGTEFWPKVLQEMDAQLAAFGASQSDLVIHTSPLLTHDPAAERFTGDRADLANGFLKREYREGFVVPEIV